MVQDKAAPSASDRVKDVVRFDRGRTDPAHWGCDRDGAGLGYVYRFAGRRRRMWIATAQISDA